MMFSTQAKHAPALRITWRAKDADAIHAGMRSENHHGNMPMTEAEVATFRRMVREGKPVSETMDWRWEVA